MSARFWPFYLIVATCGGAVSAAAGAALGNYAAGSIDPFYSQPRFVSYEGAEPAERSSAFIAAAADLESQWPVGSVRDE